MIKKAYRPRSVHKRNMDFFPPFLLSSLGLYGRLKQVLLCDYLCLDNTLWWHILLKCSVKQKLVISVFTRCDHDQSENMATPGDSIFLGSGAINLKLIFNLLPFVYGDPTHTAYDAVTDCLFDFTFTCSVVWSFSHAKSYAWTHTVTCDHNI